MIEKYIFWDWNGTLLNDSEVCCNVMNTMLSKRGMDLISLERYKDIFNFPVIDYYRNIGFDFHTESFEQLSVEFITGYNKAVKSAELATGSREVLEKSRSAGKSNVIISAMEHDMLVKMVSELGLQLMFSDILGIDDIYARSKIYLAVNYINEKQIGPEEILFIGDTRHDFEVAAEIGCRCVLVAAGHQSYRRLLDTGTDVVCSLSVLIDEFCL